MNSTTLPTPHYETERLAYFNRAQDAAEWADAHGYGTPERWLGKWRVVKEAA